MKILITGATGFVGGRFLEAFGQQYGLANVVGTGRNVEQIQFWQSKGVQIEQGDLSNKSFTANLLQKGTFEVVVHVAAKSSPWGSYDSFYQSNVVATRHLLDAAVQTGVKRFIFISTPSVYFNFSHRFEVRESDPIDYQLVNNYTKTKYESECLVRQYAQEKGLFTVILRPRAIVGRGDTVIAPRVLNAYHQGKLKIIGDGKNIADFTSVANLAQAALLAMRADARCNGQIFNITDGNPQPIWQIVHFILKEMKLATPLKSIPYSVAYGAAWLSERVHEGFMPQKEPALTCYGIGILYYSLTMNIDKAKQLLGYEPQVDTYDSLREFVKWYHPLN
jgi:nucleoside-diphosphate-sugar epimerase